MQETKTCFSNHNHTTEGLEAESNVLAQNLTVAIAEKARELGGPELEARALDASDEGIVWPGAGGLELLEEIQPGVGRVVIDRWREINEEGRALEKSRKRRIVKRAQKYGQAIMHPLGRSR